MKAWFSYFPEPTWPTVDNKTKQKSKKQLFEDDNNQASPSKIAGLNVQTSWKSEVTENICEILEPEKEMLVSEIS